jgi:Fe-S cluster assembly protein SufB
MRHRRTSGPKSLDEVDPELLKVYEKLGIPLKRAGNRLAGVGQMPRQDRRRRAVFDSVSVVTTFKEELKPRPA